MWYLGSHSTHACTPGSKSRFFLTSILRFDSASLIFLGFSRRHHLCYFCGVFSMVYYADYTMKFLRIYIGYMHIVCLFKETEKWKWKLKKCTETFTFCLTYTPSLLCWNNLTESEETKSFVRYHESKRKREDKKW